MKRYTDRERGEVEEYRVGDLVLLSTKDLKYQMVRRHMDKFTEHFVGPYKVKAIISSNAIELDLPSTIRIHPVVNVSRVRWYKSQVEGQRKETPQPVVIEGEEEWVSQTSFGHNSTDTCTIPTVQDASESPQEDLSNNAQNVSK